MVTKTEQDGRTVDEDSAQDIADRAASSYTKEFLFSQSNNDRQILQMVDGALARIREGNFGECISCGKEINAKRLEAVPWAKAEVGDAPIGITDVMLADETGAPRSVFDHGERLKAERARLISSSRLRFAASLRICACRSRISSMAA